MRVYQSVIVLVLILTVVRGKKLKFKREKFEFGEELKRHDKDGRRLGIESVLKAIKSSQLRWTEEY